MVDYPAFEIWIFNMICKFYLCHVDAIKESSENKGTYLKTECIVYFYFYVCVYIILSL